MFQQLVEFKKAHGHCNVPHRYTENYALGKWVQHQREAHKKDKLSKKRIIRLKEIGFIWSLSKSQKPQSWGDRFQQLVEFKEVHGHCNVPQKDPKYRQLGSWVSNQRRHKKAGVNLLLASEVFLECSNSNCLSTYIINELPNTGSFRFT